MLHRVPHHTADSTHLQTEVQDGTPFTPQPLREQEYPPFFSIYFSIHSAVLGCIDGPTEEASDPKKWKGVYGHWWASDQEAVGLWWGIQAAERRSVAGGRRPRACQREAPGKA